MRFNREGSPELGVHEVESLQYAGMHRRLMELEETREASEWESLHHSSVCWQLFLFIENLHTIRAELAWLASLLEPFPS